MHPLDLHDRRQLAQEQAGLGNVQHHQVLHRGMPRTHLDHRQRDHPDEGSAPVDRRYDPLVWLGNKIGLRSEDTQGVIEV